MLASLLSSDDALTTLISPLAGLLGAALFANYFFELKRSTTPSSVHRWPARAAALAVAALFVGLVLRGWAVWAPSGPDLFESKRAGGVAALGAAALALGFAWPRTAGLLLERVALALAALCGAALLAERVSSGAGPGSGLLGNTGYDMQILLPGAALGLVRVARGRDRFYLGSAAFVLAAAFAASAPVIGGALVLAVLAALVLVARPRPKASFVLLAVALAGLLIGVAGRSIPSDAQATTDAPATEAAGDLGGVGVRMAIWGTLFDASNPLDYGIGQFQAAYPPYRSPEELAASTGNHTIEAIAEVEHPHNDLLLAWAEGRGAWPFAGGLLLLSVLALLALRRRGEHPLALGALALMLAGGFHAPLLVNPLAATLGWGLAGAFAGGLWQATPAHGTLREAAATDLLRRGGLGDLVGRLGCGAASLLLLGPTFDWLPVKASQLTSLEVAREAAQEGRLSFDLIGAGARSRKTPIEVAAWWDLALELRPHSIEALAGRGLAAVRQGDLFGARKAWLAALELDPAYPVVQNNLARLGADLVLAGHLAPGLALLEPRLKRAGLETPITPKALERLAATETAPFDAALNTAAAWLHSRELFDTGSTSMALFELRRAALLASHNDHPPGALGVELAVVLSLDGQVEQARRRIAAIAGTLPPERPLTDLIDELPERLRGAARLLAPAK